MTATSLRNSLPFRNALRVVRQNTKMTIVTCILQILGIPLGLAAYMWSVVADSHAAKDDFIDLISVDGIEMYAILAIVFLSAAVFMGMFAAINSFTEAYKKTKVDMLYALPLTGTQRFFSDYAGGCLMYIVPYIIAVLLGWGVIFSMCPLIIWGECDFDSFGEFMSEAGKLYALGSVGLFLLMLLYYTMSVLITVCCGTLFESIYMNILLNGLLPGTAALIIAIITDAVSLEFEYAWHIIGFMSPVGGLVYLMLLLSGEMDYTITSSAYNFVGAQTTSHEMLPSYLRWAVAILLLSAAMLVCAWLLYKRRKAEDVGKPFIYIAAYYVMLTLGTVAILCIMRARIFGPVLLAAAIAYFIMEVIRKRGFKRFWLSVVTYLATVVLSVGGYFLITATGCFGRVNYVPASVGVSSVRVEFTSDYGDQRTYNYTLEYTDRDVISSMTKLHRDIIHYQKNTDSKNKKYINGTRYYANLDPLNKELLEQRYAELIYNKDQYSSGFYDIPFYSLSLPVSTDDDNEYERKTSDWLDPNNPLPENTSANYVNVHRVEITYYTLTGSTVHRVYSLNADQWYAFLDIVRGTKLYAEASADGLTARMENEYTEYVPALKKSMVPGNLHLKMLTTATETSNSVSHSVYIKEAPKKFVQLADAYRFDMEAMTAENFRTADIIGYISGLPVYSTCQKTRALLKEWGMEEFNTAERIGFCDKDYQSDAHWGWVGMRIYSPDQYRTASADYPHSTADSSFFKFTDPAYEDYMYFTNESNIEKEYPELYALLKAARRNYVTSENCYILNFDGTNYIIPEKDTDLAKAVIAKGSFYSQGDITSKSGGFSWSSDPDDYDFFSGTA